MRRWMSVAVAMLVGSVFVVGAPRSVGADGLCANTGASVFGGGNGSVANPYLISTTAHLVALSDDANNDTWGCNFKQTANIDLVSVTDWRPIGYRTDTHNRPFSGIYDGGGFSITNLAITAASARRLEGSTNEALYDTGLFGFTERAVIENVSLLNPTSDTSEIQNNQYVAISGQNGFLIGETLSSVFRDISISAGRMPVVLGSAGSIAGRSYTSFYEKISIANTQFLKPFDPNGSDGATQVSDVGGFVGSDEGSFLVRDVTLSGVVIEIKNKNQQCVDIGGFTGETDDMTSYREISVETGIDLRCSDVTGVAGFSGSGNNADRISVYDTEVNAKIVIAAGGAVQEVAGVVGDATNASVFEDVKAKSSIAIVADDETRVVGGLIGRTNQALIRNVSIDTTISIRTTAQFSDGSAFASVRNIGGAIGDMDDTAINGLNVDSDITINTRDASVEANVRRVAGVAGEQKERGSMLSVLSNTNINIDASGIVDSIGGLVGEVSTDSMAASSLLGAQLVDVRSKIAINTTSTVSPASTVLHVGGHTGNRHVSLTDSVISSTITTTGTGTHSHIGGLMGQNASSVTSKRSQVLNRVVVRSTAPTVPQGAQHTSLIIGTDVAAFATAGVRLAIAEGVLFDSTIAGVTSPGTGQPGTAATTTQLADVAYLKSQGFDTDTVWCVNAGRPALVQLTPSCQSTLSTASGSNTLRGRVGVPLRPHTVSATGASGSSVTFAVSPALPSGLLLNTQTGVISGTPRKQMAATEFTVTVSDGVRTSSTKFTLSVGKRPKFVVELADRARGIIFAKNSATLSQQAKKTLRKMAKRLRNAERVVIQGHVSTNEAPTAQAATTLSRKRAVALRRYLTRLGVSVDVAVGYDIKRPSRINAERSQRATVFWLNP